MFDDFEFDDVPVNLPSSGLRTQAIKLFERCLSEQKMFPIITFLEAQMLQEPPPFQFLREMDEDLQLRIHTLRTERFEVRARLLREVSERAQVDLSALIPANQIDRVHQLSKDRILQHVSSQSDLPSAQRESLDQLIENSIGSAARLNRSLNLAAEVHTLVTDWLDAISVTLGRRYWSDLPPQEVTIH